ncbi:MAG: 30S ribosomal protein S12 methylthiotransferase RimO [Verrucomicrobiales bacterium]|nr:30S ribosomal protein S12 methylthiotransferase RimO [Verrucomicrobiales bacterium]
MISLGCAKNLVDAEIMLGSLQERGIEITEDTENADVVIVNTCSFIDSAQEESVDTILETDDLRKHGKKGQGLIVSGCLPQRFKEELPKLLPEVDAFIGIDQVRDIPEIVEQSKASRAEKIASKKKKNRASRKKVSKRLAELDAGKTASQHEKDEAIRGTDEFGKTKRVVTPDEPFVDVNKRPNYIPDVATPRYRLTPKHLTYLKIAEGCNHPCSFCIIPRMRGTHRSRQQDDIVAEAKRLIKDGVKEINLISQDTTYYGLDLRKNPSRAIASPERFSAATNSLPVDATTISSLLRELNSLRGDFWVRMLYTHPAHWMPDLITTMRECRKVAKYIDIPLQHIHPTMLQRMRRETSGDYIRELIAEIRAGIPGIAIRTTFIVGFPGETDNHFDTLLDFIRETRFERLGVFSYSQEEKTIAGKMTRQLPDEIRQERRALAMAEQHDVARELSESMVGRKIKVLVEGKASEDDLTSSNIRSWEHGLIRDENVDAPNLKGRYQVARGEADAPDIDGRVYIRGHKLPEGKFAKVKIVGHTDYDLIGEAV